MKISPEQAVKYGFKERPVQPRRVLHIDLIDEDLSDAVRDAARELGVTPSQYGRAVMFLMTLGGYGKKLPLRELVAGRN